MYNKFMQEKELNVQVGDIVSVQGNRGIVTEVFRGYETEWNGAEYAKIEGTDYTNVKVHFTDELANWGQYQDGVYGLYTVIDEWPEWEKYYEEVGVM